MALVVQDPCVTPPALGYVLRQNPIIPILIINFYTLSRIVCNVLFLIDLLLKDYGET